MGSSIFVARLADTNAYAPGGHAHTENRRLLKTDQIEIILGRMTGGGAAKGHVHKRTDQMMFILQGTGTVMKDGRIQEIGPDTLLYIPAGVFHGGDVPLNRTDKPLSFLLVYSPPLDQSDIFPETSEPPGKSVQLVDLGAAVRKTRPSGESEEVLFLRTENLEITLCRIDKGLVIEAGADGVVELMLYLIHGSASVLAGEETTEIQSGDLALVPQGVSGHNSLVNRSVNPLKLLLIRMLSPEARYS